MGACASTPQPAAPPAAPRVYLVVDLLDGINITAVVGVYTTKEGAVAHCAWLRAEHRASHVYALNPDAPLDRAANPGVNETREGSSDLWRLNLKSELYAGTVGRAIAAKYSRTANRVIHEYVPAPVQPP